MGTAMGAVFEYLVTQLPAPLAAVDPSAVVADGWVNDVADHLFVVGRNAPDTPEAEAGLDGFILLGGMQMDEEFTVPCYIDCWAGGDDQATVRNAAIALFDAFVAFLKADLTLGGALKGGYYAELTSHTVIQTNDPDEAAAGRRCVITFSLHCKSRY